MGKQIHRHAGAHSHEPVFPPAIGCGGSNTRPDTWAAISCDDGPGGMLQGAASAMWDAQEAPPVPVPSFKIPTPAKLAHQQWSPAVGPLPLAPPTSIGSGGGSNGGGCALPDIHPAFASFMVPVLAKHNGRVSVTHVLRNADKLFADLPCLTGHVDKRGRRTTCRNHLLGCCNWSNKKCTFAKGHI